jgi:hypothetical protein
VNLARLARAQEAVEPQIGGGAADASDSAKDASEFVVQRNPIARIIGAD